MAHVTRAEDRVHATRLAHLVKVGRAWKQHRYRHIVNTPSGSSGDLLTSLLQYIQETDSIDRKQDIVSGISKIMRYGSTVP